MNKHEIWRFQRTRLAPSPTGALHLGHARTFLITWWLARQVGAEIIFRMEDLDALRVKPESVQMTYDDLRWLGIDWDCGPQNAKEKSEFVQSERIGFYQQALGKLWQEGKVFPCTCTRAQIAAVVAASGGAPHETDVQVRYPQICRGKTLEQIKLEAQGGGCCWRLKVEDGMVEFQDHLLGAKGFDVGQEVGDFPVTRFGLWDERLGEGVKGAGILAGPAAYQLACVVDDAAMEIDAVIRGDDLLASTSRQLLIYRALGKPEPSFGHVPLVIGTDGKRLAKRHGESRIAQFRERGVSAERIVGWVAWRSGQMEKPDEISAREILGRFDIGKMPRERIMLDEEDLKWLSGG